MKLSGNWLFTRDDRPQNKDVGVDTSDWRLAKAPGPWKHIYGDGRNFTVGWYRGDFEFAPALIGQEAVLSVNAYLARVRVYVDGEEVYQRPHNITAERYFAVQPIPVRFKVARPHQVIAIRVETPVMTGIYQLPFELRAYDPHDMTLVLQQIWGGELRTIAAYVLAAFGCFFLLVYAKTRYSLYLVAAASGVLMFPFFAAPGDYFLRVLEPETALYLQFPGLIGVFFFYLFTQYFHKFTPKLNWTLASVHVVVNLIIGSMVFKQNIDLFQATRTISFVLALIDGALGMWMLAAGLRQRRTHTPVLLIALSIFMLAGVNDVLLAFGAIDSISVVPAGAAINLAAILFVACSLFANTFRENSRLVKKLANLNQNLENVVAERTAQLREKTHDIQTMMENMPQGVLTVVHGSLVHSEFSDYLKVILETDNIASRSLAEVLFARSRMGSDALSQVEAAIASCIGEDQMNFEFNSHVLPTEVELIFEQGRVKVLELSWSAICNDDNAIEKVLLCLRDVTALKQLESEAGKQRRELQQIGEILAVTQEKFNDFLEGAKTLLDENERLLSNGATHSPDLLDILFRNMHTIKGNARTYSLLHLTHLVHEAEQAYQALRNAEAEWDEALLRQQLADVRAALDEYARINHQVLGRKGPGRRGNAEKFLLVDQVQVNTALQGLAEVDHEDIYALRSALDRVGNMLHLFGTDELSEVLSGAVDALPSLARELGKEPPEVRFETHGLLVRTQISRLLQNLFTHLLRNNLDHGLQPSAERLALGLPPAGRIEVEMTVDESWLHLRVRDDGRGLALDRIRRTALERGQIRADSTLTMVQTAELIFVPGFSTADKLTEVSGRGVGMDAVRKFLEKEGGRIEICLLDDDPTAEFTPFELLISLPERFAASPDAAQTFRRLHARSRTSQGSAVSLAS